MSSRIFEGAGAWLTATVLALLAFTVTLSVLMDGRSTNAIVLTGVAVSGDEAGAATIPIIAAGVDDNADPSAGANDLVLPNPGTLTVDHGGVLAAAGYMYFGAQEPFSAVGIVMGVDNATAASELDDIEFWTGLAWAGTIATHIKDGTDDDTQTLAANGTIATGVPAAWSTVILTAFSPLSLYYMRISFTDVITAATDITAITYAPHRAPSNPGVGGAVIGVQINGGSGVENESIVFQAPDGGKFFNGLTGPTSTGSIANVVDLSPTPSRFSTVLFYGDNSTVGPVTVTAVDTESSATLGKKVDLIGTAASIVVAPVLNQVGTTAVAIPANTFTARVSDTNGKWLLAATNVIFNVNVAAFGTGLQSAIFATTDDGVSSLNTTIASLTPASGGVLTATATGATDGTGSFQINGPNVSATLIPLSVDTNLAVDAATLFPAGSSTIYMNRNGNTVTARVATFDTGGQSVASAAAASLVDSVAGAQISAVQAAGIAVGALDAMAVTAAPVVALGFVDTFDIGGGAAATYGAHSLTALYPLNGATAAFSSAALNVEMVGNPTAISVATSVANAANPEAGPGEIVTFVATVTGADLDVDGDLDVTFDGTVLTWNLAGGGTIMTQDIDLATAGTQTPVFGGTSEVKVLSTGTNLTAVMTVTAMNFPLITPQSTTLLFTASSGGAAAAISVSGETALELDASGEYLVTVVDSAGAGVANVTVQATDSQISAAGFLGQSILLTNASGEANFSYAGSIAGTRLLTFSVLTLLGNQFVGTGLTTSVTVVVTAPVPPEPETVTLSLDAGGQFVAWTYGETTAAAAFADLSIAWLWNGTAWVSFLPALGITNFTVSAGNVLWLVADAATDLELQP